MVIWTDNAISHITEFIDESKANTEEPAKAYMEKLVDYVQILDNMPKIGKATEYSVNNIYELRQLIYKKHRIIYHIKEGNTVILAVLHTRLDINKALNKLKRNK